MKQILEDIKNNKIKQGIIWKRSRFLHEWRQRWIVLTYNNLYAFEKKQIYSKPTQKLHVSEIISLKSYFHEQKQRNHLFRIESKNTSIYFSTNTNQQKWSWISAIERMTDHKQNHIQNNNDVIQPARTSIFRESTINYKRRNRLTTLDGSSTNINMNTYKYQRKLSIHKLQNIRLECHKQMKRTQKKQLAYYKMDVVMILNKSLVNLIGIDKQEKQNCISVNIQENKSKIKNDLPNIIVDNPIKKSKILSIVKTQEIQIISKQINIISKLFNQILISQQQINFFIYFVVELAVSNQFTFQSQILQNCIYHKNCRYFQEGFLQLLNRQIDDDRINQFIKFLILIFEQIDQYFYISDLKVLIDILLRELEIYRSQYNHYLILHLFISIVVKSNWIKLDYYRVNDLQSMVDQITMMSPSIENREAAQEILKYIHRS